MSPEEFEAEFAPEMTHAFGVIEDDWVGWLEDIAGIRLQEWQKDVLRREKWSLRDE